MPFHYYFGGLHIASDIPFKRLRPVRPHDRIYGRTQIFTVTAAPPAEDERLFDWPGRFGMRLGKSGDDWRFIVATGVITVNRDASIIRIFATDPADTLLTDLFVRRVLPRLVKLQGGATYHAASLEKDGQGILVMGESGAGKSTMSAGLALTSGWTILGDDMAMAWHDAADVLTPSGADIAIWPQSADGLSLPDGSRKTLLGYDGKQSFEPLDPADAADAWLPVPIKGIFFLRRSGDCDAVRLTRLAHRDALPHALRQVVLLNPNGIAAEERVASITRLNTMLKRVGAWELTYPSVFSAFDDVSQTLLAALAEPRTAAA